MRRLLAGRGSCRRQAHRRLLGEERRGRDPNEASRRPVEIERDEDEEADDDSGGGDRDEAPAEHGEVESQQAKRDRGAEQLEPEHRIGHAVVQPGEADGLLVDHVVQAVDVERAGRCRAGGR